MFLGWMALLWTSCAERKDVPSDPTSNRISPSESTIDSTAQQEYRFRFSDRTNWLDHSFSYRNGEEAEFFSIVESLGGGVGLFDYDRDGALDLLATGGGKFTIQKSDGHPCALFRNVHDGLKDVAVVSGLDTTATYTHGVSVADFDNDGFQDLLLTGFGGSFLFHNAGDGTFRNITRDSGVDIPGCSTSAAWADFDGDSDLDIYVARYVNWSFENNPVCTSPSNGLRDICPPSSFDAVSHYLFLNDGSGKFLDATRESGLRADGKGLGVVSVDIDDDRDPDIYVANDTTDNFLYINDGKGHFAEAGLLHGVARDDRGLPNGSMGVAAYDYDNDANLDLWVANYEREAFALYRNIGEGQFQYVSRSTGITALGGAFVGFGTEFCDFDSDGRPEIVCTNGHVIKYPTAAPRQQTPILVSYDGKRFVRQAFPGNDYFSTPHEGRGLATGDINGDGRCDIVFSNLNQPIRLLVNETKPQSVPVRLHLVGTRSSRDAIGASVVMEMAAGRTTRQIVGGGSYLSHSDRDVWLSCPSSQEIIRFRVYWPSGIESLHEHPLSLSNQVLVLEPFE